MPVYYASGTSSATTITGNAWRAWTSSTITNTAVTNNNIFGFWASQTTTYSNVVAADYCTDEQREEMESRHLLREQEAAQAEETAMALLMEVLDPIQRAQLSTRSFFTVAGANGITYRIHKGRVANIHVIERGRCIHRLCAHPNVPMPDYDVMLAQKLHLEADEAGFVALANRHRAEGSGHIA